MNHSTLVSIGVITYNSGKYVLETLESIRNQTYSNLELIISDDFSTDDTVVKCKKWINENSKRFAKVKIIETEKNTGIPSNINRAVQNSQGEWYKGIAGDDLLLPDAIEKYVDYVSLHNDAQLVFARMFAFYERDGKVVEEPYVDISKKDVELFNNQSPYEQYVELLKDKSKSGGAPTAFAKRELFLKYPYNELYKGFDDVPQWIRLTRNGVHLNMMNDYTVK